MQRQKYGQTQLRTTKMGLGLAALGRPAYINLGHENDLRKTDVDSMEKHTHQVLDIAWDRGIRYFDVARSYGKAEEFLASWLDTRMISPRDLTVGSKWGYTYTGKWKIKTKVHEVKEHSAAVLMRQWGESSHNLGRYLKLYQIHSATLDSGVLDNEAVLNGLWQLRAEGTAIGLSLSGPKQSDTLMRALEIERDGVRLFQSVQATWNVLERSAGPALQAAHEAGLGVMVKEALANGRLTARNANNSDFQDQYRVLLTLAHALNVSVDAVALAFVLEQPWVDMVLSGVAQRKHLYSNLDALTVELTPSFDEALNDLVETPAEYWNTRSKLPWN